MESISDEQILKAVKFLRSKSEQKNSLFAGVQKVTLQFCMFKLPVMPRSVKNSLQIRIVMPHSLPNLDTCMIVADGENRGDRTKIDDTINFYEELLRKAGITEIKEIIPLLKMKLEYQTFESKFALATRYNTFLADASVCRFLPALLGKAFYGNKRVPVQVDLKETGLAQRLKKTLQTQVCQMSLKGANNSVLVGQAEMTDTELLENVRAAIAKISDTVPGGKDNIFKLSLRLHDSEIIPIYISSTDRSKVPVPPLPEHWQSKQETLEDEVSTVKGKVTITPDGSVIVTKLDGRQDVIGAVSEKSVPGINRPARSHRRKKKVEKGSKPSTFARVNSQIKKQSKVTKKSKSVGDKEEKAATIATESSETETTTTPATKSKRNLDKSAKLQGGVTPNTPQPADAVKQLPAGPTLKASTKKRKLEASEMPTNVSPKKSPKPMNVELTASAKTPTKSPKTSVRTPAKTFVVKNQGEKTPAVTNEGDNGVRNTPLGNRKLSQKTLKIKTPAAKTHLATSPAVKTPAIGALKEKTAKVNKTDNTTPGREYNKDGKTPSRKSLVGVNTPVARVKTPSKDKANAVQTPKKMSFSAVKSQSNSKVKPTRTPGKSPKSAKKMKPTLIG